MPADAPVGWVEAALPAPLAVPAGVYVASAFFAGGKYPDDPGVFASQALVSGPLTGPQDGGADGRNGVFSYGQAHAFPTEADPDGHAYYVDFRFF